MKVKFSWYKSTGKFYTDHEEDINAADVYECLERIKDILNLGIRPGLIDGHHFNCLVEVTTVNGPMSHLFVRGQNINV